MAVNESRIKWRAHYTRFSSRNAGAASLQARPGGIRDSLRREASQAAGAAPTLRYGPAGDSAPRLRLKAAGMAERFPFGPASTARKSTPRCPFGSIAIYGYRTISNEIQNHWLICIPPFSAREHPSRAEASCQIFDLLFLQQLCPAVGAHVRRGQLDCCDGLHGEGCVVSTAGVQAALLADVGAAGRLRVAPCAAPCKRPILGRSSSQVQAASRCLLFDCHRWRYDPQFCETTAKQDGFGRGFGPETGPWKASRQTLVFRDARRSHNRVLSST